MDKLDLTDHLNKNFSVDKTLGFSLLRTFRINGAPDRTRTPTPVRAQASLLFEFQQFPQSLPRPQNTPTFLHFMIDKLLILHTFIKIPDFSAISCRNFDKLKNASQSGTHNV
ncbi:MAG: hypothetical protein KDD45_18005 [Bdellovibrionales bacterium]|nr:hypothetical protein [Bdellovibrionales bacterium]